MLLKQWEEFKANKEIYQLIHDLLKSKVDEYKDNMSVAPASLHEVFQREQGIGAAIVAQATFDEFLTIESALQTQLNNRLEAYAERSKQPK